MSWKKNLANFTQSGWRLWNAMVQFTREHPLDPLPIRHALKGYRREWFKADLRGGLDGALLAIPQGIAFAVIAGLPLVYGVTCSAVACIVGSSLASSRHAVFGPTNATAFMLASYFAANPHISQREAMPMLVFLVGALLVIGAYCRIADMTQFISRSVVVAYLAGAAVQMYAHQIPVVLGETVTHVVNDRMASVQPKTLFSELSAVMENISTAKWPAILVSIFSLFCYLGLRRWSKRWPALAVTLVASSLIVWIMRKWGVDTPTFADATFTWRDLLPPFPDFTGRGTGAHFSQLFGLCVSLAFLVTLDNSSMSRTLASRGGHEIDSNQDMFGLGAANLACAYLSGMPASHSLTRSLLNFESGARTPLSIIISGVLCLGGALLLGPLVAYIPKAGLGILVICVASSLINPRQIRICLRATKSDAFVFITTFIATLLVPLHVAIFTGIGLSVILYLRKAGRPSLVEYEFNKEGHLAEALNAQRQHPSISIVHVEGDLFFGAAELFRTQIQRACADPNLRIIILRLKNARHLDATSVLALEELIINLRSSGRDLIVSGAMRDVYRVLKNSGLVELIGRENFFMGSAANPNISTRNALRRAQEILGVKDADIHIYFDPRQQAGSGI